MPRRICQCFEEKFKSCILRTSIICVARYATPQMPVLPRRVQELHFTHFHHICFEISHGASVIASEPKIVPSKAEFYSPVTQAKKSVEEHDDLVSETLATIYRQQGNLSRARFCYEKLSLLIPGKSAYFAALIKEIDEELNKFNQEDL